MLNSTLSSIPQENFSNLEILMIYDLTFRLRCLTLTAIIQISVIKKSEKYYELVTQSGCSTVSTKINYLLELILFHVVNCCRLV